MENNTGKWNSKVFWKYIITTFVIAWILQVIGSIFALKGNSIVFQLIMMVCMYAPFIGVLVAKIPLRGMGFKPKLKGNILTILLALIAPTLFTVLGAVLYFVIFQERFDLTGKYLVATAGEAALEQLEAAGLSIELYLVVGVIQSATIAPLMNMLTALGEEVGWRGAMQPMLIHRFGRKKGLLLGGFIWGVWHWPVMIIAGYEYGLDYVGYPILGMVLFCLFTTVMGILLEYCYSKTKCIWVPALAHGAINAAATIPVVVLDTDYLDQMTLGPAPIGIISILPMLFVAIWILMKKDKQNERRE